MSSGGSLGGAISLQKKTWSPASKPGPVASLVEVLCRCWRPTGVEAERGGETGVVFKEWIFLWLNIHAKGMRGDEFQVHRHK